MSANERFVYRDDDKQERPLAWSQFRRLAAYVKPYRKPLVIVLVTTLIGMLARLGIPLLTSYLIDDALLGHNGRLLLLCTAGMFGLYASQLLVGYYRTRYTNIIGQNAIHDLRNDLFRHLQRLSFRYFDQRPVGSVLVRVTNDVHALQDLFTNGIVTLIIDCVQLVGIVILLLTMQTKLALAVIVIAPVMALLSVSLQRRISRAWQQVRRVQSKLNSHLNESIQGVRVTQAYVQEPVLSRYFEGVNADNRKQWDRALTLGMSFGPFIELSSAVGTFVLLVYGSFLIHNGTVTIGLLVAFIQYIASFWDPINRIAAMYNSLLTAMASSERIFEVLDERPNVGEKPDARDLPQVRGEVELDQVSFEYEPGRPALHGVSLSARPGQSIALVGHTGSGKSTIVQLLCRFYDPTAGSVRIDGHDLREVSLASVRSQIGIVMQDTFLFAGTIRDNIRFGRLDATDLEVEEAAKAVSAHDFIVRLPNGYNTEVEERGGSLSAGQRQLLSFARAILANPRILVLDEATASIDTETERTIQQALSRLLAGRNSFIIAHRLSTIRAADRIVVLDHGRIVEQGDHHELLAADGAYAALVRAQYRSLTMTGVGLSDGEQGGHAG